MENLARTIATQRCDRRDDGFEGADKSGCIVSGSTQNSAAAIRKERSITNLISLKEDAWRKMIDPSHEISPIK
ncbi:hypothetical protein CU100_17495 [Phyllobacterium endophyticum]|uniref:Uncharacterized protein n=1 Tax=Phyllobacterium endophyticum TaxID=1149773 RepID=A0A2P7AS64_9HYPH|nr:hypothetical protein CU100_17495 [Phyllobacterium endophyticum]